jgi:hypothetical protein
MGKSSSEAGVERGQRHTGSVSRRDRRSRQSWLMNLSPGKHDWPMAINQTHRAMRAAHGLEPAEFCTNTVLALWETIADCIVFNDDGVQI